MQVLLRNITTLLRAEQQGAKLSATGQFSGPLLLQAHEACQRLLWWWLSSSSPFSLPGSHTGTEG